MAMLAEPRQNKRYNLVPRGKALYEDDTRYGTKMLEKMGWSKGKGLGANEDGSKDFVRVRYKNDAQGLGFEERDDQWTEHANSFNGFLKELNGENPENISANLSGDEGTTVGFGFAAESKKKEEKLKHKISGESLEEKSKRSKARVHYKKFTRGKDLSRYSEKDLANIFGKKAVEEEEQHSAIYKELAAIVVPNMQNDLEDKTHEQEREPKIITSGGTQMFNTGLSINDYFKQKMEALKNKKHNAVNQEEEIAQLLPLEGEKGVQETVKIASKKKKTPYENYVELVPSDPIKESMESILTTTLVSKKKKKKSNKLQDNADEKFVEVDIVKKSKTSKEKVIESLTSNEHENNATSETAKTAIKTKKRKQELTKRVANDCEEETTPLVPPTDTEIIAEETAEVKSKKKKKTLKEEHVKLISLEPIEVEMVSQVLTKKKKKKNHKSQNNADKQVVEDQVAKNGKQSKEEAIATKTNNEHENNAVAKADETVVIKTKKRKQQLMETVVNDCDDVLVKKQKKSKTITDANADVANTITNDNNIKNKPKTSSKKKTVSANNNNNPNNNITSNATQNHVDQISLDDLIAQRNAYNIYTISSFCAEKFRNTDLNCFTGSNMSQINGYALDDDLQLNIKQIKGDEERITQLWNCTLTKYRNAAPKHTYINYAKQVRTAREARKKPPRFHVKTWQRKHAFQCL